jgi:hypothetical protein
VTCAHQMIPGGQFSAVVVAALPCAWAIDARRAWAPVPFFHRGTMADSNVIWMPVSRVSVSDRVLAM